jgi:hypothetical protein
MDLKNISLKEDFERKSTNVDENESEFINYNDYSTKNSNDDIDHPHSTDASVEELSINELEEIIENLLNNKIELKDLPSEFQSFKKDIQNIPLKPNEPRLGECCGSGCSPCVWDRYDRDLECHQRAMEEVYDKIVEFRHSN